MNPRSDQLTGVGAEVEDAEIQIATLKQALIPSTVVGYVKSVAADETGTSTHLRTVLESRFSIKHF